MGFTKIRIFKKNSYVTFNFFFMSIVNLLKKSSLLSYYVRMFRMLRLKLSEPKMSTNGHLFIGSDEMTAGDFERCEYDYFRNSISNADIFINVGANIGYYVAAALHLNKKVVAFEPDINNFSILQKNVIISNNPDKCLLFNMGVGSKWDTLKIFHAGTGSSFIKGWANNSSSFYNNVGIVRLNDFNFLNYKNLLFLVDVEGFESEVIFGATEIIKSDMVSQTWIIEIMTGDEHISNKSLAKNQLDLLYVFKENNFRLFFLSENGESEISFKNLEESISARRANYGHNFIFKKHLFDK
jgi:FkbM family methyltransferase